VEKWGRAWGKHSEIEAKLVKVGMVGIGLMGVPMARRLHAGGHVVRAYSRSPEKLVSLQAEGVMGESSVAAVLTASECTVLMLSDAGAIAATLLASETLPALRGKTVIQMGTIAPAESRGFAEQVTAAGGEYLEAPVLGSIPQAETGTLIVMVGSSPAQFEQWQPVLQCFGSQILPLGPVGAGAAMKLAMNQLIGSLTTAFALSLALVQREGIAVEQFMDIVRNSALYAPTFDKKLNRMLERDFDRPNFPTKHLLKDMRLFSQAAIAAGLPPNLSDTVAAIVEAAISQGLADQDYSALYAAINPAE
jgi:3-hydroxyisobutyrate dehydrogenase